MSRNKMHVRRGDQVQVISGNHKGARGTVLRVIPAKRQAPIEAMRIYTIRQPELVIRPGQGKATRGAKVTDEGVRLLEPIPVSGVQLGENGEADVKITFKVNDQQILFIKIEAPGVYEERQMEF